LLECGRELVRDPAGAEDAPADDVGHMFSVTK
jgi:hypothetical protein